MASYLALLPLGLGPIGNQRKDDITTHVGAYFESNCAHDLGLAHSPILTPLPSKIIISGGAWGERFSIRQHLGRQPLGENDWQLGNSRANVIRL